MFPDRQFTICGDYNIPDAVWYNEDGIFHVGCHQNSIANIINEPFNLNMFQICEKFQDIKKLYFQLLNLKEL